MKFAVSFLVGVLIGVCLSSEEVTLTCTDASVIDVHDYLSILRTPSPPTGNCLFKIQKKQDVCQIRLDFRIFTTDHANINGTCESDSLQINNSITVADGFTTCGELRDQHMYLSFGSSGWIDITPRIVNPNSRYEIIVSQIPCSSSKIVPSHCLQHFDKTTDIVRSFDFPNQQQSNQHYVICVEPVEESQSILWRQCGREITQGRSFFITGPPSEPIAPCETDWVQVNGVRNYCGENFPDVVSTFKPYNLYVNFDDREVPYLYYDFLHDAAGCAELEIVTGGVFICVWVPGLVDQEEIHGGSCHCDINPAIIEQGIDPSLLFGGPPDANNTGFCLEYQSTPKIDTCICRYDHDEF